MKNNDYKNNFFVALKNGKFGIFRAQTSLEEITRHLQNLEAGHTQNFYYSDYIEVYFDNQLRRIKIDISSLIEEYDVRSLNWLQMGWVNYLLDCTPNSLYQEIKDFGIECLYMEGRLGWTTFHHFKPPSALSIYFDGEKLALLTIEFEDKFKCIREFDRIERLN